MKYVNHEFRYETDNRIITDQVGLIHSDYCNICNKKFKEIDNMYTGLTFEEIKKNPNRYGKCLTEDEYIIKKILE